MVYSGCWYMFSGFVSFPYLFTMKMLHPTPPFCIGNQFLIFHNLLYQGLLSRKCNENVLTQNTNFLLRKYIMVMV